MVNYTNRVMTALESAMGHEIAWQDCQERVVISAHFADLGFPGCIGLVDDTIVKLSQRPRDDGETYFDGKSNYSMNVQTTFVREFVFNWDDRTQISTMSGREVGLIVDTVGDCFLLPEGSTAPWTARHLMICLIGYLSGLGPRRCGEDTRDNPCLQEADASLWKEEGDVPLHWHCDVAYLENGLVDDDDIVLSDSDKSLEEVITLYSERAPQVVLLSSSISLDR
ncbi:hypothetical protein R1sor_020515 [Riccia sorocarpa]|uniref:Uncharacterized protein n=1 Tax=Riccia sorocarpa TaxID=122646 RepID=A0ABD3IFI0_9MARC